MVYKKFFILTIVFIIYLSNINILFAIDLVKNNYENFNCANIQNYYERALCVLKYIESKTQENFSASSGIYDSYDKVNKVVYDYLNNNKNLNKGNLDDYLTEVNNADYKYNIASNKANVLDSKDIINQVSMMFVNGDDNDISQYDILYELSKVEALIIGGENVNKKLHEIKNDKSNKNQKINVKLKDKNYDKSITNESTNSILGHITYMQKAVEEMNRKTLLVRIVTGFPFIPGNATDRNLFFRINMPLTFEPVNIKEDAVKNFEYKNSLDMNNINFTLFSAANYIKTGLKNVDNVTAALNNLKNINFSDNPNNIIENLSKIPDKINEVSEIPFDIISAIERYKKRWENITQINEKIKNNLNNQNEIKKISKIIKEIIKNIDTKNTGLHPTTNLLIADFLELNNLHLDLYNRFIDNQLRKNALVNLINNNNFGEEEIKKASINILNQIKFINKQLIGIGDSLYSWANTR